MRKGSGLAWTFLLVCLPAFLTSACFGAQAKTVAVSPLDMPVPPPRDVQVSNPEVPPPLSLPEEPIRDTPLRPRPAPPAADAPRPAEPPKPEAPVEPPKPAEEVSRPTTTLQTTPTQQEVEVERRIRAQLNQAIADLNRINYQALNNDAKTQYDTAKRFITQADEAVREKNLVFATNLAEKAASLAAQLAGR
jgi:hypothetical protein